MDICEPLHSGMDLCRYVNTLCPLRPAHKEGAVGGLSLIRQEGRASGADAPLGEVSAMRLKVGRRIYDTRTSTHLARITNWEMRESPDHVYFDLYRTSSRRHFVCVTGGKESAYARDRVETGHIVPLDEGDTLPDKMIICAQTYGDAARTYEEEVYAQCDNLCLDALARRGEIADQGQMSIFDVLEA